MDSMNIVAPYVRLGPRGGYQPLTFASLLVRTGQAGIHPDLRQAPDEGSGRSPEHPHRDFAVESHQACMLSPSVQEPSNWNNFRSTTHRSR